MALSAVVFIAAMILENVVFASGISSGHGVLVGESFVLIFYAPPLIISFFSSGFLSTMFFILTIWHFGLSISVYRPSNALNFPWRLPPEHSFSSGRNGSARSGTACITSCTCQPNWR